MSREFAIIIGAGPAGLTAALELLRQTDIIPIVIEQSEYMGGISRTVNYKGNRIDIGGHRFFSKSDRVMEWWSEILPLESSKESGFTLKYQGQTRTMEGVEDGPNPEEVDEVMLIRKRKSRIYWRRRLFDYPLSMSPDTIKKMGLWRMFRAGMSYIWSNVSPVKPEKTLEDFLINRFGRELYSTFFKAYTEKVWGVPCHEIPASWGAQRIKGLSILKAIKHALTKKKAKSIDQKDTETSLIEWFLYPKLGPGQMWDTVAAQIREKGGEILTGWRVESITADGNRISQVGAVNIETGEKKSWDSQHVFSSMPIKNLFRALTADVPDECKQVAEGLMYRDFFTVGLVVKELKLDSGGKVDDNWIYIQEPDVLIGRLQIFNNWSPYLVNEPGTIWLGLEYFCDDTDEIWSRSDEDLIALGTAELEKIGIIDSGVVLDGCVIKTEKAYPAYFGAYEKFDVVQSYLSKFENLYCVGRNGQHRYNNQDHSMLTAMISVENIAANEKSKENVWNVNVEEEYHESK